MCNLTYGRTEHSIGGADEAQQQQNAGGNDGNVADAAYEEVK